MMEPLSPTSFFYLLISIFTLFLIKFLLKQNTHKSKRLPLPPGPKPWPIVGSLPEMLLNRPTHKWIENVMTELKTEIACIRLGRIHVILVTSPEIARDFLKKQDTVFASRPVTWCSKYITGGFLSAALSPYGDQWKKMKRIISGELISAKRLRWLEDKRIQEADNLVKFIYQQCVNNGGCGLINVRVAAQHYAGNVIRRLLLNLRYFGKGGENCGPGPEEIEHVESLFMILQCLFSFSVTDFMPCLSGYNLDGSEQVVKKAYKAISKYHDPIIKRRVEEWKNGRRTDIEDLLDIMINLKDSDNNAVLNESEIKSVILDLTLAAIDNPSNAVEWAMAEMLNQPELIEKAVTELDQVVGTNRLVEERDLPNLHYVRACVREAFRMHPISEFNVPHLSMEDTVVGNYRIPKGSYLVLSRKGLGTNQKIWADPFKFKPDRHFKADGSAYDLGFPSLDAITFSTGKRGCPGLMLGTSMSVMLFARILHSFAWSVSGDSLIDLDESQGGTTKAHPLMALAKPRLPAVLYDLN